MATKGCSLQRGEIPSRRIGGGRPMTALVLVVATVAIFIALRLLVPDIRDAAARLIRW